MSVSPSDSITTLGSKACKRCSSNKKKCDKLIPRCTGCVLAKVPCEAAVKTGDQKLLNEIETLRSDSLELRRQVDQLRDALRRQQSSIAGVNRISGDISPGPSVHGYFIPLAFTATNKHPVLSSQTKHTSMVDLVLRRIDQDNGYEITVDGTYHEGSDCSSSAHTDLPTIEDTRRMIRSLLKAGEHGPSNLDRIIGQARLEEDCRIVYGPGGLNDPAYAASRFRCFVTVYLAMCMSFAVDGKDVTCNTQAMTCRSIGLQEAAIVTVKQDLQSVEALTLLAELAIHDPIGPSLWQLVGMAVRAAIAIEMHRCDEVYLRTLAPLWPPFAERPPAIIAQNQRRKELFWALYSIDRLTSFVLNRACAIKDEDIDIDLPPITMWPEGRYATISSEALWAHHLQARRLYGQIQSTFYGVRQRPEDGGGTLAEEQTAHFAKQVQQWYMSSRFNAIVVPFSDDSVKRHVLDDIQYHQMIMAIHQPSNLISQPSSTSIATLKRSASLSVNLFHHCAIRKQINVHWVNLYHFFTSCVVLLYCYLEHQTRSDLVSPPQDEAVQTVLQCRETFTLLRGAGSQCARYEELIDHLIRSFEAQFAIPPIAQYPTQPTSPQFDFNTVMNDLLQTGNFQPFSLSDTMPQTVAEGMPLTQIWTSSRPNTGSPGNEGDIDATMAAD